MIFWFEYLSGGKKIAVVLAVVFSVGLVVIGGLYAFSQWPFDEFEFPQWSFSKKDDSVAQQITIPQEEKKDTAIIAEDNKGVIAGRDINIPTGTDPVLYGNVKEEAGQAKEKIRQLEEKLASPFLEINISLPQLTPPLPRVRRSGQTDYGKRQPLCAGVKGHC